MAAPMSIVPVLSFKTRGASTELCAVVQRHGLSINGKTSSVFINVCPLSTTKKCHGVHVIVCVPLGIYCSVQHQMGLILA